MSYFKSHPNGWVIILGSPTEEALQRLFLDLVQNTAAGQIGPEQYRLLLQAAIRAGLLLVPQLAVDQVSELSPAYVAWLAREILEACQHHTRRAEDAVDELGDYIRNFKKRSV